MAILRKVTDQLGDTHDAKAWLGQLVSDHDECFQDSLDYGSESYPFFDFLSQDAFALLAIFRSPEDVTVRGLRVSERKMIEATAGLELRDVDAVASLVEQLGIPVLFEETTTVECLKADSD